MSSLNLDMRRQNFSWIICFSFTKPVLQLFSFPSCTSAKSWPVSSFSIACPFLYDSTQRNTHKLQFIPALARSNLAYSMLLSCCMLGVYSKTHNCLFQSEETTEPLNLKGHGEETYFQCFCINFRKTFVPQRKLSNINNMK